MCWPSAAERVGSCASRRRRLSEIDRTLHEQFRHDLANYAMELLEAGTDESAHGGDLGRRLADSSLVDRLPDRADRELLGNAIGLGCEAFVTTEIRTMCRGAPRFPSCRSAS